MDTSVENKKKVYKTRSMPAIEKVLLFEEYIKETGEPIVATTVYKGVPIGRMLISLRSAIALKKHSYDKEVILKLSELNLLDKRVEKVEEKINRVKEYCEKNEMLWNLRQKVYTQYTRLTGCKVEDEMDMERMGRVMETIFEKLNISPVLVKPNDSNIPLAAKIIKEFQEVYKDYDYLRSRKSRGHLKESDNEKMKKTKVGKVFGTLDEVTVLSQKTGIEENELKNIIKEFGSLNRFRDLYIQSMIDSLDILGFARLSEKMLEKNKDYLEKTFGGVEKFRIFNNIIRDLIQREKIVACFDISKPGFIADRRENSFVETILESYGSGLLVNGAAMESAKDILSDREKYIFDRFIGAEEKGILDSISKEYGFSRTRIQQIRDDIRRKINHPFIRRMWNINLSEDNRVEFLKEYFDAKDIFITEESFDLDDLTKINLLSILQNDFNKTIGNWIVKRNNNNIPLKVDIYEMPIEDLGLSANAYTMLVNKECKTIEDILRTICKKGDFFSIDNYSEKSAMEITRKMHALGLKFKFEMTPEELSKLDSKLLQIGDLKITRIAKRKLTIHGSNSLKDIIKEISEMEDFKTKYGLNKSEITDIVNEVHRLGLKFDYEITAEELMKMNPHDINKNKLNLSNRAYNALEEAGFETVGDIIVAITSEKVFSSIPRLGEKSIKIVKDEIHRLGFKFPYECVEETEKITTDEKLTLAIEELQYVYEELDIEEERTQRLTSDFTEEVERIKENPEVTAAKIEALRNFIIENKELLIEIKKYDTFMYKLIYDQELLKANSGKRDDLEGMEF